MTRERKMWVMDYETIVNCFTAVFTSYSSSEIYIFIVNRDKNDIEKFIYFLEENIENKDWHLGYNNIGFDSQITEFILDNKDHFLYACETADEVTKSIYAYAQNVIAKTRRNEFLDYPEFRLRIPLIDIYKLNHWDSNAKRTSLKWAQFSMDWENLEEMPHPHYEPILNDDTLNDMVSYCINDVLSTKAIFLLKNSKGEQVMASQINLRSELTQTYNINLLSASEPKISKEVFLHYISEKLKIDKKTIKEMRTLRSNVVIRDVILPMVKFSTPEFQNVLNWFKGLVVDTTIDIDYDKEKKKGPKHTMIHKGVKTDYGLGGLHGCIAPGVYKASKGKKILSADVTSFYPNLSIKNRWSPAHLPKEDFCELYEWLFFERKKYPKSSPLNYLFKIILNATYGLSKSRFSFLYDPEFTFRITVNGQLQLSMLYEMLSTRIPGAQPLMQNTDGLEFLIDEEYEELFYKICKEWEDMTMLQLETVEYSKMIIGDVNNYIAIDTAGKTKCKGRFEYDELPLHKNKSMLIVPKALYAYFINGVDPVDFLKDNRDISDYCIGSKLKGDWFFIERKVNSEGYYEENKLQKMLRYYVSKTGVKLIKCHPDGRKTQLNSGPQMQTLFNKMTKKPWEDYGVNEKFYLDKIYEEIKNIEGGAASILPAHKNTGNQLTLF
jgi:hypothetical protein